MTKRYWFMLALFGVMVAWITNMLLGNTIPGLDQLVMCVCGTTFGWIAVPPAKHKQRNKTKPITAPEPVVQDWCAGCDQIRPRSQMRFNLAGMYRCTKCDPPEPKLNTSARKRRLANKISKQYAIAEEVELRRRATVKLAPGEELWVYGMAEPIRNDTNKEITVSYG